MSEPCQSARTTGKASAPFACLRRQDRGMTLSLPIDPEATKLLHDSPLALLLGMLLDQQIPMEKAFSGPYVLKQRLGHDLDAHELDGFDPEALETIFAT